ncbi:MULTISPECIES: FkbM family methyltransferase [Bacillus cereus group]|uniref:FkbM family methyltransferase n=1 Tax=Bacillus cereus group TaxID=86661 RepID=UPI0001A1C6A8|nr:MULTISPECIES: FkbM family methyltransferase [Bacillus cereus group]EEM69057.1 Methyltransferase FkbM [Bacillus thuringiensis serovar andalousiensis BGSC 4AW1]MEB9627244.1 FkbM family methyltransferase [Bacillus anthracis]OUA98266.1 hypothetical protein BK714_12945 [Bacillus thuringiensis serovar oswaldocruzi]
MESNMINKVFSRKQQLIYKSWNKKANEVESIKSLLKNEISSIEVTRDCTFIKLNDGRKYIWDPKSFYSLSGLVVKGQHELEETNILKQIIKEGDCVIDGGANYGWFTVLFGLLVGNTGEVHAFEPFSPALYECEQNIAVNNLGNVVLNQQALSSKIGNSKIYLPKSLGDLGASFMASLEELVETEDNIEIDCFVNTIDNYIHDMNISNIKCIKLDIEGAEISALQGAEKFLKRDIKPLLMIEVSKLTSEKFLHSPEDIFSILKSYGYTIYEISNTKLKEINTPQDLSYKYNGNYSNIFCLDKNHVNQYRHLIV